MRIVLVLLLALIFHPVLSQNNPENILLKDYRPVSIYNIQKTEVNKPMFPVIDMHTHPYARSAEDIEDWIRIMDDVGLQKSIVMTYAHGDQFDSLAGLFGKYPDRFELWCGIDYSGYDQPGFPENAIKELKRCHHMGAKGVGELGDKGKGLFYCEPAAWGMHSDDPRMIPLFSACAELGMPVNIHVADPKWMYEKMDASNDGLMNAYEWRLDNQPDIVDHAGMIRILENTVKQNKKTTFVACHLANCCYDLSIVGGLLDRNPNLFIDIGARYAELAPIPRATREFFIRYQERIVYGTDMGIDRSMYRLTYRILETADEHFYAHERFGYHWALNGLDLPAEVLEKVYHKNAEKILKK
ncbi:MAG: amidohydrolase [Cyclobacteriaceae bacterium]|nr:amidohydrolase [Cyclobacteriaceae bacterium]